MKQVKKKIYKTKADFSATDLMAIATERAGGDYKNIDIEDAFVILMKLAPNKFSWRTKQLPDISLMQKAWNNTFYKKQAQSPFIKIDEYTTRLSPAGVEWLKSNRQVIDKFFSDENTEIGTKSRIFNSR